MNMKFPCVGKQDIVVINFLYQNHHIVSVSVYAPNQLLYASNRMDEQTDKDLMLIRQQYKVEEVVTKLDINQ